MDILIPFMSNLIDVVQNNLIGVFLLVVGAVIVIKVTSNLIKTIASVIIMLIFIKICLDLGVGYLPMPI